MSAHLATTIAEWGGIPISKFCSTCGPRLADSKMRGDVGVAFLCEPCMAIVDAARPVAPTAATEHPAPWRWVGDYGYNFRLDDAVGEQIVWADNSGCLNVETTIVRELIRLAPDMEALLRHLEWSGRTGTGLPYCTSCGFAIHFGEKVRHGQGCAVAVLLAALDAARKNPVAPT